MTSEFFRYLNDLALTPIIKALRLQARDCAEVELDKALKKGYLKHSDKDEAKKLIHQVFKAFLHAPTMNLRHLQNEQSESVINAMRYIFDLQEDANAYKIDTKDTNEI